MIILTTLKQKDLSAVSAQQLFNRVPNSPTQINRFDLYEIQAHTTEHDLVHAIKDSYIFSNPNKHHLILARSNLIHSKQLFFIVSRKTPLVLTNKVIQLNKKLGGHYVTSITHSELWALTYTDVTIIEPNHVIDAFITSSPTNIAPFAHPMIHHVTALSFDELNQNIGVFTGSINHDS